MSERISATCMLMSLVMFESRERLVFLEVRAKHCNVLADREPRSRF